MELLWDASRELLPIGVRVGEDRGQEAVAAYEDLALALEVGDSIADAAEAEARVGCGEQAEPDQLHPGD
jgi:hypothetical protein